ncbi:MAG: TIGR04283 family arsenosugar biosynthesis glycosyltransferase [Planctomycetota bacterium]|jgi:rSAM/selenodomain-associated transferase 2
MKTEIILSVIIPVLNESQNINSVIENIRGQEFEYEYEVIVVDADANGSTIKCIQDTEALTITSGKGRACQMNAGAEIARGEILLFLHADTVLSKGALSKISQILSDDKYVAGAFDLCIDSDKLLLKFISARANWRSRFNRIPYGDQAIFIKKDYFEKIGQYNEIPIMEDVDLMRRIKKDGEKIYIFRDKVKTSPRRWEKEGVFYTTIRNQILIALYYLGVSPYKLVKFYRSHSK